MRWMSLVFFVSMLSACGFASHEVIEHQQVVVTPVCETVTVSEAISPPVDVTITNIDYY